MKLKWRKAGGGGSNLTTLLFSSLAVVIGAGFSVGAFEVHQKGIHAVSVQSILFSNTLWGSASPQYTVSVQNGTGSINNLVDLVGKVTDPSTNTFSVTASTNQPLSNAYLAIFNKTSGQWLTEENSKQSVSDTFSLPTGGTSDQYIAYLLKDPDTLDSAENSSNVVTATSGHYNTSTAFENTPSTGQAEQSSVVFTPTQVCQTEQVQSGINQPNYEIYTSNVAYQTVEVQTGTTPVYTTEPVYTEENVQTGTQQVQTGTTQESVQTGTTQESVQTGTTQESVQTGTTQESVQTGTTQESVQTGTTQESVQTGATQVSVQTGTTQESVPNTQCQMVSVPDGGSYQFESYETCGYVCTSMYGSGKGKVCENYQYKCYETASTVWVPNYVEQEQCTTTYTTETVPTYTTETVYTYTTETVPTYTTETVPVYTTETVPVYTTETVPVYTVETVPVYTVETVPVYTTEPTYTKESIQTGTQQVQTGTTPVYTEEQESIPAYLLDSQQWAEPVYTTQQVCSTVEQQQIAYQNVATQSTEQNIVTVQGAWVPPTIS